MIARRQRGTTLIECLAALTLLGMVLTASYATLHRWRLHQRDLGYRLHAQHAAEKELATLRSGRGGGLTDRDRQPLVSDPVELSNVPGAVASVTIAGEPALPGLKRVRVAVSWDGCRKPYVVETLIATRSLEATP